MEITSVKIEVPPEINIILGQAHFIKTVDGESPVGIETEKDVKERKTFLRTIGYKR